MKGHVEPGTVIIDGKTCKACVPDTDLLEGREVITVEGLTEGRTGLYLCIRKGGGCTVWLLYPGNGDVHKGASGRK